MLTVSGGWSDAALAAMDKVEADGRVTGLRSVTVFGCQGEVWCEGTGIQLRGMKFPTWTTHTMEQGAGCENPLQGKGNWVRQDKTGSFWVKHMEKGGCAEWAVRPEDVSGA